jgi:hypothetical protein
MEETMKPPGNWMFIQDPDQLKEHIQKGEALAAAVMRIVPIAITESALKRMGYEAIGDALDEFKTTLRDFLCCELEQKLKDQEANPLPKPGDIVTVTGGTVDGIFTPRGFKPWVPTPDDLYRAQRNVEMIEGAIEKIQHMKDDDIPGWEMLEAAVLPAYEGQLAQAKDYLETVQKKLDEAAQSPMSNEVPSVEAESPGEANIKD